MEKLIIRIPGSRLLISSLLGLVLRTLVDIARLARGGGGGGTLIFSYIRRLGSFFVIQNVEFHYFFRFSEK